MKKMILLSMFALGAWTINAQPPVIESGGFWDNWSMGLQGGGTMKMSGTGFFKSARPAFGSRMPLWLRTYCRKYRLKLQDSTLLVFVS